MTKDTSGPAFPCKLENNHMQPIDGFAGDKIESGTTAVYAGVTVREYAAIKAMQGLLANSDVMMHLMAYAQQQKRTVHDVVAGASANYVDALLTELAKEEL